MPLLCPKPLQLIACILQHRTANPAVVLGPSLAIPTTGEVLRPPQRPKTSFGAADSHTAVPRLLRDGRDTKRPCSAEGWEHPPAIVLHDKHSNRGLSRSREALPLVIR